MKIHLNKITILTIYIKTDFRLGGGFADLSGLDGRLNIGDCFTESCQNIFPPRGKKAHVRNVVCSNEQDSAVCIV